MSTTIAKRSKKKSYSDEIIMRLQKENNQLRNTVEILANRMLSYEENMKKMREELDLTTQMQR